SRGERRARRSGGIEPPSLSFEPRAGIEPATFPLRVGRSGRLSYRGVAAKRARRGSHRYRGMRLGTLTDYRGGADATGFEPATGGFGDHCSGRTELRAYGPIPPRGGERYIPDSDEHLARATGGDRTRDLALTRRLRYLCATDAKLGTQDSNLEPSGPEPDATASCASAHHVGQGPTKCLEPDSNRRPTA